jgi:hypothetical protein
LRLKLQTIIFCTHSFPTPISSISALKTGSVYPGNWKVKSINRFWNWKIEELKLGVNKEEEGGSMKQILWIIWFMKRNKNAWVREWKLTERQSGGRRNRERLRLRIVVGQGEKERRVKVLPEVEGCVGGGWAVASHFFAVVGDLIFTFPCSACSISSTVSLFLICLFLLRLGFFFYYYLVVREWRMRIGKLVCRMLMFLAVIYWFNKISCRFNNHDTWNKLFRRNRCMWCQKEYLVFQ